MSWLRPLFDRLRPLIDAAVPSPALRPALPGLLAVGLAIVLFPVLGPGGVDRQIAAETLTLADQLAQDDEALRRELHPPATRAPDMALTQAEDPQAFLKKIVAAATGTGMQITRLSPRPHDTRLLDVEASASFPELLRFVTEVELLHGAFHGLRVHEPAAGIGRQEIAFALEMPPRIAVPGVEAAEARAAAADPALRNPFPLPAEAGIVAQAYQLTGITQIGRTLSATIDGRDYQLGDSLGDMVVTAIQDDAVSLAAGRRHLHLRLARPSQ